MLCAFPPCLKLPGRTRKDRLRVTSSYVRTLGRCEKIAALLLLMGVQFCVLKQYLGWHAIAAYLFLKKEEAQYGLIGWTAREDEGKKKTVRFSGCREATLSTHDEQVFGFGGILRSLPRFFELFLYEARMGVPPPTVK